MFPLTTTYELTINVDRNLFSPEWVFPIDARDVSENLELSQSLVSLSIRDLDTEVSLLWYLPKLLGHLNSLLYLSKNFKLRASVARLDVRLTGDQEVAGLTPAEVSNILSWRLIMKYFSPLRWFKKGSCQFLAKECAQYRLED